MTEAPKFYVTLKTTNRSVADIQSRIDKYSLLEYWINKAIALLDRYLEILAANDKAKDPKENGIHIEQAEASYYTSVSFFIRCFMDQKGTNLKVKELGLSPPQEETFKKLRELRDDEFVHWKGIRSNVFVTYEFKPTGPAQCEFGKTIQVNFQESFGHGDAKEVRELYLKTRDFVHEARARQLDKLRDKLSKQEGWSGTDLLNPTGESIIKRS